MGGQGGKSGKFLDLYTSRWFSSEVGAGHCRQTATSDQWTVSALRCDFIALCPATDQTVVAVICCDVNQLYFWKGVFPIAYSYKTVWTLNIWGVKEWVNEWMIGAKLNHVSQTLGGVGQRPRSRCAKPPLKPSAQVLAFGDETVR